MRVPKRLLDALRGILGDVLVERARHRARRKDALDGGALESTERSGVSECEIDLFGAVALAQEQDLPCLPRPRARRASTDEAEELGGALAHAVESDAELIEIDGALALRRRV